jgi:hypothetical protein
MSLELLNWKKLQGQQSESLVDGGSMELMMPF